MSSPSLAAQLVEDDLVEEYRLMIEPILVGGGKRLFPDDRSGPHARAGLDHDDRTRILTCTYRPVRG
jgi:riboflavin biosynthesis pyrimidine reductase